MARRRHDRRRRRDRRERNERAAQIPLDVRNDEVVRAPRRQIVLHVRGGWQVEFIFEGAPKPGALGQPCVHATAVAVRQRRQPSRTVA